MLRSTNKLPRMILLGLDSLSDSLFLVVGLDLFLRFAINHQFAGAKLQI